MTWSTTKALGIVAAGALSAAVAGFAAAVAEEPARQPAADPAQPSDPAPAGRGEATADAEAARPLALPPGVTAKDLGEDDDIRNAFAAITEEALDDDVFDDVVKRLVDADRNRIGKFKEGDPDLKPLKDRATALGRIWREKYGKELDVDEKVVFGEAGFLQIAQGEISDPAQVAAHWPVAPTAAPEARVAGERQPADAAAPAAPADAAQQRDEAAEVAGGDVNLDKGRNVAVVRFPASHGMPAIDASLIHELPDIWRFDLPDTVDGKRLHDNLLNHLNLLGDGSQWPADPKAAARVVAHHVLSALYDVGHTEPAARPAAAKQAGDTGAAADPAAD